MLAAVLQPGGLFILIAMLTTVTGGLLYGRYVCPKRPNEGLCKPKH